MAELSADEKRIKELMAKILDQSSTKEEDREYNMLKKRLRLTTAQIMAIPTT